ncbi:hypothetical protein E4U46_006403, partial [Claviceps purpurea]
MARTSLTLDAELPENMPAFELGRNIIINDEQDWAQPSTSASTARTAKNCTATGTAPTLTKNKKFFA